MTAGIRGKQKHFSTILSPISTYNFLTMKQANKLNGESHLVIDPQSHVWGSQVQTSPTYLLPKVSSVCTKLSYCLFVTLEK